LAVVVPFENPSPPSIARLIGFLTADMERVNAVILSRTGSDVAMIPEVANHLIASGGKRLRPMLTLAMARLAGYTGDGHIKLAAAVEFMHTATLLHDDVVDESEMRRGKLAARLLWGNEASVLVGDFLLGQAFKMMVEVGSLRSLEILSSAAAVIAVGAGRGLLWPAALGAFGIAAAICNGATPTQNATEQSGQRRSGRCPPLKWREWIQRSLLSWLTSRRRTVSTA